MRGKRFALFTLSCAILSSLTGCLPTQTIIVRFEDLKSDFFALEASLEAGEWIQFDRNTNTVHISSTPAPVEGRRKPATTEKRSS